MTMTAGGAIVGTIEYMAPEQARGVDVDQRADIYAFGLILHDLLLGRRQAAATTAVAELMERMQHAPAPVRETDPSIPAGVDALITACLQPDRAQRFQTMGQVIAALDALDENGHPRLPGGQSATNPAGVPGPAPVSMPQPVSVAAAPVWGRRSVLLLVAAVLLIAGAGGLVLSRYLGSRPAPAAPTGPAISLAVVPFRNNSGDPTLDSIGSSLSDVLRTSLGQTERFRTIPPERLHQVLRDLRIAGNAQLTQNELKQIGDLTTAGRVLWGEYARFGDEIRINATLHTLENGDNVPLTASAREANLLGAVAQLAAKVQEDLASRAPDILADLKSTSWKPSTASFDALRAYNEGQQLTQQGIHQDALKKYQHATQVDPNFALGFSALARAYSRSGFDAEAQTASKEAMRLSDALPPQEKFLIQATHYGIVNDTDKAIEAYVNLANASPNSTTILYELGSLYEQQSDLTRAREQYTKIVQIDPKYLDGLLALGRVEINLGKPQDALTHLTSALNLATQLQNEEARGNGLQAIGVAYKLLDRPNEALANYQQALEIRRRRSDQRGIANSLSEIGQIQERIGNPREAELNHLEALKIRRAMGSQSGIGSSLLNLAALYNETLGRPNDALPLLREALEIQRGAGNPFGQALVMNNIGTVYLGKGDYSEAQTYFERALEIRQKLNVPTELADTHHNLGETLSKRGNYEAALKQYLRALDLRRQTSDQRHAAIESYSIGAIFDYQGSYGRAIKSKEDALASFRELKQRDAWLGEILSGLGSSFSLSGRMDEATKHLDEAMTVARELKNPALVAQTLRLQAERAYYAGDWTAAQTLAQEAARAAAQASDRSLTLFAQARVAMIASALQPTTALASRLGALSQEADTAGLKSLAVECALHRVQALHRLGNHAAARQEADRALARAESFGFRLLRAKAHFLRAEVLRQAKDASARREYGAALRFLTDLRADDGNQNVLRRADLAPMFAASEQGAK
jgi:tetratricopeptide (TPR) repeat protein